MAKTNKDAAFGLRAIGKVGQNRDNQGLGEYSISSGDTTKIFFQDAVSATAAGKQYSTHDLVEALAVQAAATHAFDEALARLNAKIQLVKTLRRG